MMGSKDLSRLKHAALPRWAGQMMRALAVAMLSVMSAVHAEPAVFADAASILRSDQPATLPGQSATLLADGNWLLIGGASTPGQLQLVDRSSRQGVVLPVRLNQPRANHSATLLPDGAVLVFGGSDPAGHILDTAEQFDPQTRSLNTIGSLGLLPRSGHTATVLTDGTLLLIGGFGADRQPLLDAELYNLVTKRADRFNVRLDTARINQIAALLPNHSVLLWGGNNARGESRSDGDLMDPTARSIATVTAQLAKQLAEPLDDASIPAVVSSEPVPHGIGVSINQLLQVRFSKRMAVDTLSAKTVTLIGPSGVTEIQPVAVEKGVILFVAPKRDLEPGASYTLFIQGATDRQGRKLPFTAIGFTTAALHAPNTVPTTGGTHSPSGSLTTGSAAPGISSSISTASDAAANQNRVANHGGTGAYSSTILARLAAAMAPITPLDSAQQAAQVPLDDSEIWVPDSRNLRGDWTSGWKSLAKNAPPANTEVARAMYGDARIAALRPGDVAKGAIRKMASAGVFGSRPGTTSISGQALKLNGRPLANVAMSVGGRTARTNANGEFILTNVPSGHQVLVIDGSASGLGGRQYGRYEYGMTVEAGKINALPFTVWMTRLDTQDTMGVSSPTQAMTVLTSPHIPGLELRIPAGTVIRNAAGKVVTAINMTAIPTDQPPFPIPPVPVPTYFTIQPGGAHLEGANGQVSQGAQLIYPNFSKAAPGTRIDFWNYDATAKGWYIYGRGTVTADGKQVMPDPDVRIYEFSGAMVSLPSNAPAEGPPVGAGGAGAVGAGPGSDGAGNGSGDGGGDNDGSGAGGEGSACDSGNAGDPVNCFTGLFLYERMVLPISDTAGIAPLTRVYRPRDNASRALGIGTSLSYDFFMVGDIFPYTYQDLITPDGGRIRYTRISPGTGFSDAVYQNTSTPGRYYGSILKFCSSPLGTWCIALKDGATLYFPNSDASTNYRQAAVSAIVDRLGNATTLTRGANFNLTKITSPNGRHLNLVYDTSNRVTQASDDSGRTVTYAYDASGRLSTATDGVGTFERYTYDSSSNMLSVTDKRGNAKVTNVYNANNRVIQQTYADGTRNSFAYTLDANGKVTQTDYTDPAGSITRRQFNAKGYVTSVTFAQGTAIAQTMTFARDPNTNLVNSVTDALGRITSYTYDALGNTTKVTAPDGSTVSTVYDLSYSLPTQITDANGNITKYRYDVSGNLVQKTDALNHSVSFAYDGEGRLQSTTDALGNTVTLGYAGADLTSATDALNRRTLFYHDNLGRLTGVQDPIGRLAVTSYDGLGRVSSTIDPSGSKTTYGYDANGNRTSVTDPTGRAITFGYDSLNRVVLRTDALGASESWTYNAANSVTRTVDRKAQATAHVYDALQRLTLTTYADNATVTRTYDAGNRLTKAVDSVSGTITRSYDLLDRLKQEQTPQGVVNYVYDAAGRRSSTQIGTGTATTYAYDVANRLTTIQAGSETVSFAYDVADRRTVLTLPNGVTTQYVHDAAHQLSSLTYAKGSTTLGTLSYAYDLAGQRTATTGTWASNQLPAATASDYQSNAGNRLTTGNGYTVSYDANGAPLSDGRGNSYTWDARQQLKAITQGPATLAAFSYDAFGRRIAKTIGSNPSTSYLYDGSNVALEVQGATTRNLLNGLGIDERYARDDTSGRTYFLTDAIGSTIALTNTTGALIQQYTYEPYGQVVLGTPSSTLTNPYQYTGRENDGTGLYYYRARYYDPLSKRFISEDPIGLAGGPNGYAYVGGNPVNFIDPWGLVEIPNPNGIIPGGPWTPHDANRPGQFLGPKPPSGQGGKAQCQYVPPEGEGGPPGSRGYWKTNQPGERGWQRYDLKGNPITSGEAHRIPIPRIPGLPLLICPVCSYMDTNPLPAPPEPS